jgi:hypothetical protein
MPSSTGQGDTLVAGSAYLVAGVDSFTQPMALEDTEVVMSMNTVNRGGYYRTRPGTRIMANLCGSNAQGGAFFVPTNGTPAYVVAVDGLIYVSVSPFREFTQLAGLQFSQLSRFVSFTVCEQSTDYTSEGQLYFLENPKTVMIMQDGVTRAAYWDGVTHGHINPTPSPVSTDSSTSDEGITQVGFDGTKIGLWSCWSNNRLWVSRGNQIFASDIGNPLKFTEAQYLNEGRAFYLSSTCTGIIETPDKDGILCFTERDGTLLLSSIQDRTQWLTTPSFQKTILPASGCVAPRSLVNQYGLTWWFSPTGLQNLNSALNQNITSKLDYQDAEMTASKQNISPDMSGVASGNYENYLVCSVPSGDPFNRHTWVLDQAPFEGNINAWPGYWTGWRPLQWSKAMVGGRERVFFISRDYDDVNRVWEAFTPEHNDNGCAITCFLQTKQHNFGSLLRKKFRFARAYLSQIWGNVSFKWWVLPEDGAPYTIGNKEIVATSGQVYDDQSYGGSNPGFDNQFRPNRPQTRKISSEEDMATDSTCTACGVSREDTDNEDYAFGLLMVWSGDMAVTAYQMFVSKDDEPERGACEENEEGPRSINFNGCGAEALFPDGNPFGPTYTATSTVCAATDPGSMDSSSTDSSESPIQIVCATQTKTSIISQANADRLAECAANFDASFQLGIYI